MLTQVQTMKWFFSDAENGQQSVLELKLKSCFPDELVGLLEGCGFRILHRFGNFQKKELCSGDLKQIVVAVLF